MKDEEEIKNKPHCHRCGICCTVSHIYLQQVGFDRKWVEGRQGTIRGNDVYIPSRCKWLTKDNRCEVQESKPEWCKKWPLQVGPQPWLINMGCKYYD